MIALPKRALVSPELWLLVAAGLFMAAVGAFGTFMTPLSLRIPYWLVLMIGGGAVLSIGEKSIRDRVIIRAFGVSPDIVAAAVTAPVIATFVWCVSTWTFAHEFRAAGLIRLLVPVLVVNASLVALRRIALGKGRGGGQKSQPGMGVVLGEAGIRKKLPPRLQCARIKAVEADDHYLRVQTEAGDVHIHMRMQDALAELSSVAGFQVHRSWWVAQDAICSARWSRGRGTLRLTNGELVPVSRSYTSAVRPALDGIAGEIAARSKKGGPRPYEKNFTTAPPIAPATAEAMDPNTMRSAGASPSK